MEWFVYIFACALLAGIATIINKKLLIHEHATQFSASRSVIILFLALFLIPFINLNIPFFVYMIIYIVSLLVSAGMIFFLKSLRHGPISVVSPMMNLSPLFLLIIAYVLIGEEPTNLQYIGVFLLIFGAYALEVGVKNKGFLEPIKAFGRSRITHFLIVSMVMFSITATFDKIIVTNYVDFITYMFLSKVFLFINLTSYEIYRFGYKDLINTIKKDFKLLGISSIMLFVADIFYFITVSIASAPISLIIPIKRTSTLFSTIFGGKLFHEDNLLVKVLACIIMIWGAVFILL